MINMEKVNKKNKYLLFVIILILLLVGATLANVIIGFSGVNDNYNSITTCLEVDYDITNDDGTLPITGDLFPTSFYIGGLSGKVGIKINDLCSVEGIGSLNLNVVDVASILIQTVDGHCENFKTLETLTDYTTESTCTSQENGIWVTDGTALKYAVFDTSEVSNDTVPLSIGYVNFTGSINIYSAFPVTKSEVNYYIYIWLDGNISDNSYAGLSFNGNISASVEQIEEFN